MPKKKDPNAPKKKIGRPFIPIITEDLGELENKLPKRSIDLKQVLYWMDLGATQEEIAGAHYVSVDTLKRRLIDATGHNFADLKRMVCGMAKIRLRNNQFKMSENNASMAIWLGKNWLGQKDTPEEQQEFEGKLASLLDSLKDLKTNAES